MSDYEPKVGDRVRMVFEGTYTSAGPGVDVGGDAYFYEDHAMAAAKSIEKIEPLVVTFKPGDVVRDKSVPEWLYALDQSGYTELGSDSGRRYVGPVEFTSDTYEKIEL